MCRFTKGERRGADTFSEQEKNFSVRFVTKISLVIQKCTNGHWLKNRSCTRPLRINIADLFQALCVGSSRGSSALQSHILDLFQLPLPSCRRACPAHFHDHHARLPAYSACDCGHGGTRHIKTSCSVHTRSVNPAAIAGVQGRHFLAEPVPLVGSDCGKG